MIHSLTSCIRNLNQNKLGSKNALLPQASVKSMFSVHTNCALLKGKQNIIHGVCWFKGEKKRLSLISKTGTCVVCSYNAYSFSSVFHIQTSKHYLGAQQVRSQHLVSRIHKLGRDCHPQGTAVFMYTACIYLFRFGCSGLAMVQVGL